MDAAITQTLLFWLFLALAVIEFIWGRVLSHLNRTMMSPRIPAELSGIYDEEEYARQQAYQRENSRFGQLQAGISFVILVAMLAGGFVGWFDTLLRTQVTNNYLLEPILYVSSLLIVATIAGLPFAVWDTFVIEERYGFNKTTPGLFIADALKSLALLLLLAAVLLTAVVWLHHATGKWFFVLAWAVLIVFSLIMNFFYSSLIVPLFNKQTPLEPGELRDTLTALATRAGFALKDIYVIDGSKRSTHANAYFTGFGSRKRIVLYDTLIDEVSTEEVSAVLAHEIGHYKHHHLWRSLPLSLATSLITLWLLSFAIGSAPLAQALGAAQPSFIVGLMSFSLLFSPVRAALDLLSNTISRKHEYEADAFAAQYGLGAALMSGLKTISAKSLSNLRPHPLVVFWEYSHPTLLQRMKALEVETVASDKTSEGSEEQQLKEQDSIPPQITE